MVTPELALVGYLPRDLLLSRGFVRQELRGAGPLAAELRCAAGAGRRGHAEPLREGRPLFNSAVLLRGGAVEQAFHKTLLPTYDVFDEDRYFEPATGRRVLESAAAGSASASARTSGTTAISGSAAATTTTRSRSCPQAGAQAIVNLSASPFTAGKQALREEMLGQHGAEVRPADR